MKVWPWREVSMRACGDERMTLTWGEEIKIESIRKIALKMHNGIVRRLGNSRYMIKEESNLIEEIWKEGMHYQDL